MNRKWMSQRETWNSVRPIRPFIFHRMQYSIVPGCLVQHEGVIYECIEIRTEVRGEMCLCVPNGALEQRGFYSARWPDDGLAEGEAYYFGTKEEGMTPE